MAGYSGKPLAEKLGIAKATNIVILNAPQGYEESLGNHGQTIHTTCVDGSDFIQFFTSDKKELEDIFPKLKKCLTSNGSLWISWPKKTSGFVCDINENIVREIGLQNSLVDVKVIAIDKQWSGLKFVYRIKERG